VLAAVDYQRRSLVAPNHTMTHVLNYALRAVLGEERPAQRPCCSALRVPCGICAAGSRGDV